MNGMQHVGGKGTIKGEYYLWKAWCQNRQPPDFFKEKKEHNLWKLSKKLRDKKKREWENRIFENNRKELAIAFKTIHQCTDELRQMRDMKDIQVLEMLDNRLHND